MITFADWARDAHIRMKGSYRGRTYDLDIDLAGVIFLFLLAYFIRRVGR